MITLRFREVTIIFFIIFFSVSSGFTQETNLRPIDICPLRIKVETDDFDCSSGLGRRSKLAGKELVLLNTSRVKVESIDFSGTMAYECKCDYGIFPEEQELIDCETGEQLPVSDNCSEGVCAPIYFFDLLYYRWIEENLVTDQSDCDRFRSKYGRDRPTFFITDFDFSTPAFIPTSFDGIGRRDRAVVMVCPWEGTDYFSYDYIKDNYESTLEILYQRAVSYETCEPIINPGAFYFDLNPLTYDDKIFSDDFQTLEDVESVESPVELADVLTKSVNGTTSDGISDILISINGYQNGKISFEDLDPKYGSIRMPWGDEAFDFSGNPFHVIIYSPPDGFPDNLSKSTTPDGHVYTNVPIKMSIESSGGESTDAEFSIPLIRPPVVLVHGTFDNPTNCWKTPIKNEKSMYQTLVDEGYVVRTVDYQQSNGDESTPCSNFVEEFFNETSISSFECNRKVVYENPGGIKDAIDYFRDTLFVAATQADVIGHSMGGVLPRVYASDDDQFPDRYNDDYYRNDNFEDGDINRLISIASTHHGSDGSEFLSKFNQSWKDSKIPLLEKLSNFALSNLLWYGLGVGESGAVKDQMPGSPALRRIGATKVPSHAIVCTVKSFEDIDNNIANPEGFGTYGNLLRGLTAYFYFFPGSLHSYLENQILKYGNLPSVAQNGNQFKFPQVPIRELPKEEVLMVSRSKKMEGLKGRVEDGLNEFWQNWHIFQEEADPDWIDESEKVYQLQYETAEYNHYEIDDDFNNFIADERYDIISGEILDDSELVEAENFAIEYIRYLMFKNDLNDCVVRYESQTGNLEPPYISHFDTHIHSFAPRYKDVIDRVKELLKEGMNDFNMNGFPAAGKKMPVAIPDPDYIMENAARSRANTSPTRFGEEAICWSGMVPAHAEAFLNVAVGLDVVILTRPVNPDATPLISDDAATKGMNLKGKSSNWGPHKGLIPVLQKYSKLWFLYGDDTDGRDKQIVKFSAKTKKQLKTEPELVTDAPFKVTYDCGEESIEYSVYVDTFETDATASVFLVSKQQDNFLIQQWTQSNDGKCPEDEGKVVSDLKDLVPLKVMAKPRENDTIYYTADYDLLAIGFKVPGLAGWQEDPYDIPTYTNFDKDQGFITDDQKALLELINEEVRKVSGYEGGDVSHHGPENQFYILDDPPEGSPYVDYPITAFYLEDGEGVIRSIPRGSKNYRDIFLKTFMAKKRRQGYDLYENIHSPGWAWDYYGKYNYQLGWDLRDKPKLKDSPEEIPYDENCLESNVNPEIEYEYESEEDILEENNSEFKVYPNPAEELIHIGWSDESVAIKSIQIRDAYGKVFGELRNPKTGETLLRLDVSDFPAGMYTVTILLPQEIRSQLITIVK